jgi:hypothetical protein
MIHKVEPRAIRAVLGPGRQQVASVLAELLAELQA